jgi:cytochrome c553
LLKNQSYRNLARLKNSELRENRSMKNALVFATTLAISGLAGVAQAEGDPGAGREKAFTCMGCHGAPGLRNAYPAYRVPKLGGQHEKYIVTALKAYQSKERTHPTMQAHAATMTEQDMADIAAYFNSLKSD